MQITQAYIIGGKTIGLSVGNASHAAVTINASDPSANGLMICNTSTSEVMYVEVLSSPMNGSLGTASAATVPGDGTAGSIPVLSYDNIIVGGLNFPISVTAISSIAGPTLLTVTPIMLV